MPLDSRYDDAHQAGYVSGWRYGAASARWWTRYGPWCAVALVASLAGNVWLLWGWG